MAIKLRMQGLSEAIGSLPEIEPRIEKAVLLRMSQIVYDESQRGAARHTKPGVEHGYLFKSLYNRPIPHGREVGHDPRIAPHAVFVNAGTRPHEIWPKHVMSPKNSRRKAALRWAVGGRFIFARFVKHPGYIGDAYMINAATIALREFARIVDEATKDAA